MTNLEELADDVPRPAQVAKRYARRLDPWWGFVIAGIIWAVCAQAIIAIVGIKVNSALGYEDASTGARVVMMTGLVVGGVLAIAGFIWWRRRRLAVKELLVREGDLLDADVTGRPFQLGGWKTRTAVDLECDDRALRCVFNRWFLPTPGDTIKLLHHPDVPHVVAFDRSGRMFSGHVRSGQHFA